MKAFLSHSSHDRSLVLEVYDALEPESVWLDRGEIEWGDVFIERIEDGIKNASDFILFWSAQSAESEWVRLELNIGPYTVPETTGNSPACNSIGQD